MANGQKTSGTGQGGYLSLPVDNVTPRHYGTCDIYRMFSDTVCITIPAAAVCKQHFQMTSPVLHALTASQLSVTKAGGLSNTPGTERSTGGGNGDTVT